MEKKHSDVMNMLRELIRLDYINPKDIPDIELYMDQVTTFFDRQFEKSRRNEDDKILTKTMINNYSKNGLLPPSNKKKYGKDHIILLIYIYYLKNFLSIGDIKTLLSPLTEDLFDASGKEKSGSDNKNFNEVYSEIFKLMQLQKGLTDKSLYSAYRLADKSYDDEEEKYLHMLAFISVLSYDIYAKKQIVESLIDELDKEYEKKNPKKKDK